MKEINEWFAGLNITMQTAVLELAKAVETINKLEQERNELKKQWNHRTRPKTKKARNRFGAIP